jgi:4-amino-4-deoxy-L-arabinose transferase and related glycosyltransferases of PMT family
MKPGRVNFSGSRREWLAVGALMLIGFVLRVIFVISMEDHPPHQVPILDSAFHVEWARAIAAGVEYPPIAGRPFFRAPLYIWFLAGIFRLFGEGLLLPRLVQCALGMATIGLVHQVGRRAFGPRAALIAASIAATYWLLVYFDGELMSETLVVPLTLLALLLTLDLEIGSPRWHALTAGAAWGLTALARPNVLLFVPLVPLWMLWARRPHVLRGLVAAFLFGIGVLLPILPVTAYNTFVKGDFALIASYGGINLWIGNNPQSNGIDAFVPGSRSGWWEGYYDAIALAERAEGRSLRASEVSRYYSGLAWDFILHEPEKSIPLFWRKFLLFWAGEYGNNEPEHFVARRYSWVPHLSIGYAALAPLALLGMALARRDGVRLFPLYAFFASYMFSLVMFFVSSRYRVPVLPVMMIFAGHAVISLWDQLRTRDWRRAGLGALFVLVFGGWSLTRGPDPVIVEANGYLLLGSAEQFRGNHLKAVEHLRRATELNPGNTDALIKLALAERSLGDHAAALDHYRQAVEAAPLNDSAIEGLLDLAEADGRSEDAERWIDAYLQRLSELGADARGEIPYYYLGRLQAARGEADPARRSFIEALRRDPLSFRAAVALGDLGRDSGQWDSAAAFYRRAVVALRTFVASRRDDRAYAGLIQALEQQGRRDLACRQARAWQARRPHNAEAEQASSRSCM